MGCRVGQTQPSGWHRAHQTGRQAAGNKIELTGVGSLLISTASTLSPSSFLSLSLSQKHTHTHTHTHTRILKDKRVSYAHVSDCLIASRRHTKTSCASRLETESRPSMPSPSPSPSPSPVPVPVPAWCRGDACLSAAVKYQASSLRPIAGPQPREGPLDDLTA
ncbi:unnamed protein product [Protopolystoma xenopodis]|uniref:Uncharacterized protein n=1 Tax=Protopolystoma xenopodis TaxID=117903 RepID=A0A448XP10_9PLAT|nr:unnamed protein product [Protopolystoma xenopodis]